MDLGIAGKSAVVAGQEIIGSTIKNVLLAEGVKVEQNLDKADIVVVVVSNRGPRRLLDQTYVGLVDEWSLIEETVESLHRALAGMRERNWGRIVIVGTSSVKSVGEDDDQIASILTLSLMALNKLIGAEEGPSGIIANAVVHRYDSSSMDDVAKVVGYLCSEEAGYLNGITINADRARSASMF